MTDPPEAFRVDGCDTQRLARCGLPEPNVVVGPTPCVIRRSPWGEKANETTPPACPCPCTRAKRASRSPVVANRGSRLRHEAEDEIDPPEQGESEPVGTSTVAAMDRQQDRDEQDGDRRREQGARPGVRGGLQGGEGDPGGQDHQQQGAQREVGTAHGGHREDEAGIRTYRLPSYCNSGTDGTSGSRSFAGVLATEHDPNACPFEETSMTGDPNQIIVTTGATADAVQVHHRDIPELHSDGESPVIAAENLANALTREVDSVSDDHRREAFRRALADARAFVERGS